MVVLILYRLAATREAAARERWHLDHGNDRFIPHAARWRQSAERALAIRAADGAAGPVQAI
jgi:hypothetical protein